jgi:hypothetical protein
VIEELARRVGLEVREASADFQAALACAPLAQKRTSKNKAYVHVLERSIVKGPYTPAAGKLINNLRYPYLLHALEEALALPEFLRGTFRWRALVRGSSRPAPRFYLEGDNLGRPAQVVVRAASTGVDADCRVIDRGTLIVRVSEREKVKRGGRYERHPDFDEEVALASLQHLYLRHLLDIGDSGTHNILIRPDREQSGRLIAGIDFDERRGSAVRRTALGLFLKQEGSYLEMVYGPYLGRITWLREVSGPFAAALAEMNERCPGQNAICVADVLERNAQVRSLMPAPG